jgi:hypothetical protein
MPNQTENNIVTLCRLAQEWERKGFQLKEVQRQRDISKNQWEELESQVKTLLKEIATLEAKIGAVPKPTT